MANIVTLLGIDGAGKTTQARWLAEWLSECGLESYYHRCEGGRSELDKLARRHGKRDIGDLIGAENAAFAQAIVRWRSIRIAADLMEKTGAFLIMDRYVYCQYAAALMQGLPIGLMRQIFSEFPAPQVVFFLEISPQEAQRRIERRGLDSDSLELLSELDAAYRQLPEFKDFSVVDASMPPQEVQRELRSQLSSIYLQIGCAAGVADG